MASNDASPDRLSIGFFSPGWPLAAFPNGIVAYVETMTRALEEGGHRVTIVAGQTKDERRDETVYSIQRSAENRGLPRRILDSLSYRAAPAAAIRRMNRRHVAATVRRAVHEQGLQVFEMEEAFGFSEPVRQVLSIPVCVRLHCPWFLSGQELNVDQDEVFRLRVRDEELAIRGAEAITTPSLDVLERTRDYYNLALADAEVIPNPAPSAPPAEHWRLEDRDPNLILFIGRFDRLKGGDLIIKAFGRVRSEIPTARLRFIGPDQGCIDDDRKNWSLLEFVRHQLPGAIETGQVECLGHQPSTSLAGHRRAAAVTVVCSRYENFPLTAVEAAALGCPIVAAKVGGVPEIVEHGRNGLLHESANFTDLAAQIIEVMKNPDRAAALGRRAAIDCERRFAPDVVAARTVDFYRRILGRRTATG